MCNNEIDIKQIILEAAEAEFLEKGFGNTKMMAIAKRAGVSHPFLHYHFQ
jgi:AcrR family transcriptional regulator